VAGSEGGDKGILARDQKKKEFSNIRPIPMEIEEDHRKTRQQSQEAGRWNRGVDVESVLLLEKKLLSLEMTQGDSGQKKFAKKGVKGAEIRNEGEPLGATCNG